MAGDTSRSISLKKCNYHTAHEARIDRNEGDIKELWKAEEATNKRINGITMLALSAMGTFLIQCVVIIFTAVMAYIKVSAG